jgi:hypothetical protein
MLNQSVSYQLPGAMQHKSATQGTLIRVTKLVANQKILNYKRRGTL